jgi:hypothetical protein
VSQDALGIDDESGSVSRETQKRSRNPNQRGYLRARPLSSPDSMRHP